jgi:hypothetical protein
LEIVLILETKFKDNNTGLVCKRFLAHRQKPFARWTLPISFPVASSAAQETYRQLSQMNAKTATALTLSPIPGLRQLLPEKYKYNPI